MKKTLKNMNVKFRYFLLRGYKNNLNSEGLIHSQIPDLYSVIDLRKDIE